MADTVHLEIITPTTVLYDGYVAMFRAPGTLGLFQVLPGHHPMISTLEIGCIDFREPDGTTREVATSGGYVEVLREGVTVLATTAEFAHEIDIERAERALQEARDQLSAPGESPSDKRAMEQAKLELALQRALNRLRIAGKHD